MPELPEVETVVRLIRPDLEGRTIEDVDVRWLRTLGGTTRRAFADRVVGKRVVAVRRRAKFFVFDLADDEGSSGAIVGHLRMTGRLHVEDPETDPGPYVRVSLELDDGRWLHFVDVRKFGRFRYVDDDEELLGDLGPEPLEDEFTFEVFWRDLRSRRRMLKPLLLDQTFVAGLGNIYVDESLFRARLHPLRSSDRVPRAAARELWTAIRATLAEAIEREGSSFDTFYRTPEGQPGSYQHQFQVYGRDGEPCRRCGATIRRLVVGQRGTHVCQRCQRAPRGSGGSRAGRRRGLRTSGPGH